MTAELLGVGPAATDISPRTTRPLKRLRQIGNLPAADQRAVLEFVDALLETRGIKQAS